MDWNDFNASSPFEISIKSALSLKKHVSTPGEGSKILVDLGDNLSVYQRKSDRIKRITLDNKGLGGGRRRHVQLGRTLESHWLKLRRQ